MSLTHTTPPHTVLATVDLGSNSFRLQVSRVVDDQLYALDVMKETVRLGAGLTAEKNLDEDTQQRALACLARFGERLRGFVPGQVRIVGTNTLRVAKNAAAFIADLCRARCASSAPIRCASPRMRRPSLQKPSRNWASPSR
ncbi:hypothetical protein [Chromobacterium amazonense]|uniref:Ppx/GppA phosphatase family protein n=1 Tax=Chromobacterium amazonense TaxID=1382803 RepID=UPI0030B919BA